MSEDSATTSPLSVAAQFGIDFAKNLLLEKKILALTGAGISTDSGIPDYRGQGRIKRHPMNFDTFVASEEARMKYWFRSYYGFRQLAGAKPNEGHFAFAAAEMTGRVTSVITQNVDGLHQKAGSQRVIDLHGRMDRVRCLNCNSVFPRFEVEEIISASNPNLQRLVEVEFNADGDAELEAPADFVVPRCPNCGGTLKPDVVFFGESVPIQIVDECFKAIDDAAALLVAGTSLAVNSGMRFVKRAAKRAIPIVIINIGPTKGDELASAKIEANTSAALKGLFLD